jgi:hypothetical protein
MKKIDSIKELNNFVEANVYYSDNPYLNANEKLEVAMWFALPSVLTSYSLLATSIYSVNYSLNLFYLFGIPITVNLISGLINWFFYSRILNIFLGMTILNGGLLFIIQIAGIIFLVSKSAYILVILLVFFSYNPFFNPLQPHLYFYFYFSNKRYKIHAYYAFFKRFYKYRFPFEND